MPVIGWVIVHDYCQDDDAVDSIDLVVFELAEDSATTIGDFNRYQDYALAIAIHPGQPSEQAKAHLESRLRLRLRMQREREAAHA